MPTNPFSRSAYILLITKFFNQVEFKWKVWLDFRTQYLTSLLEKNGDLVCEYCGKTNLTLVCNDCDSENLQKKMCPHEHLATLDHVTAHSKGGDKYDVKNLKVSCVRCNSNKKDLSEEEFLKRRKESEQKQNEN